MELTDALAAAASAGVGYVAAIRALPPELKSAGTTWLGTIVDGLRVRSAAVAPDLGLFTA